MKAFMPSLLFATVSALAQTKPACTSFTVVMKDKLDNVKQGLEPDDIKWFQKSLAKKYTKVCYAEPGPSVPIVFYTTRSARWRLSIRGGEGARSRGLISDRKARSCAGS
jgi:hypothetical protein